jgi:Na+/proline symporter
MRASLKTSFVSFVLAGMTAVTAMFGSLAPASAAGGTWHRGGWHGHGAGWGVGLGVGALAAGAAIASTPYYYGYGPGYYNGPTYYAYGPGYYSYGPPTYSNYGPGCTPGASMYYGC